MNATHFLDLFDNKAIGEMKDGHVSGRNDKFSQRCRRKTSSKENHISKLKNNIASGYTPPFILYVSDRKTSNY
jgi:hypothetical protein